MITDWVAQTIPMQILIMGGMLAALPLKLYQRFIESCFFPRSKIATSNFRGNHFSFTIGSHRDSARLLTRFVLQTLTRTRLVPSTANKLMRLRLNTVSYKGYSYDAAYAYCSAARYNASSDAVAELNNFTVLYVFFLLLDYIFFIA